MSEFVVDARGRKIEVEDVVGVAKSKLHMAMGRNLDASEWAATSLARARVRAIEGRPMPPLPTTLDQVHQLWDVVDDDATLAAFNWMVAKNESLLADAGNVLGHPDSETASIS